MAEMKSIVCTYSCDSVECTIEFSDIKTVQNWLNYMSFSVTALTVSISNKYRRCSMNMFDMLPESITDCTIIICNSGKVHALDNLPRYCWYARIEHVPCNRIVNLPFCMGTVYIGELTYDVRVHKNKIDVYICNWANKCMKYCAYVTAQRLHIGWNFQRKQYLKYCDAIYIMATDLATDYLCYKLDELHNDYDICIDNYTRKHESVTYSLDNIPYKLATLSTIFHPRGGGQRDYRRYRAMQQSDAIHNKLMISYKNAHMYLVPWCSTTTSAFRWRRIILQVIAILRGVPQTYKEQLDLFSRCL
jgi:hypothetical protein